MKILLRGRPDYGRESPEYTAGITETMSWLTDQELAWLTDPRDGLHTVCQYLPTPADVHNFLKTKRVKEDQFKSFRASSCPLNRHDYRVLDEPRPPFRPYLKLWEAFAGEPHLLKSRDTLTFDRLTEASRRLAMEGREAARVVLEAA